MSDRIGPMAWGAQGQVFLGEDLVSTRDYSDETARVIDEEVEKVLRHCEDRCEDTLSHHRKGLDLVSRALLEHETISGAEVARLVQLGLESGAPEAAIDPSPAVAPPEPSAAATGNGSPTNGDGPEAGAAVVSHETSDADRG